MTSTATPATGFVETALGKKHRDGELV